MSLTPGTRLGSYEILGPLGAGGMGEVYKARDTRLDRTVAIKVLPEALAADPQFRERFDREARAISHLDHPHICALYDVGEHLGTAYLVMQYLDGETLADRLEKGALPFDQALRIAIEIAAALDRAHRSGIVHRDLKPANVMLTKGGSKLLDFGLAKASVAEAGRGAGLVGGSMLPTTPANLTMQGAIIGTFQYMAPEQLEGKEADARTDIFAFGAVLYEMVTGRKAFVGQSQASLISAIMASEPPLISSLQSLAPSSLDQIVRTCLAKDPDERWQTAADVERQLKWIADGRSQAGTVATPAVTSGATAHRHGRAPVVATASALAGALIAAVALRFWGHDAPVPTLPTRVSVMLPANRPLAFGWTPGRSFALSPDGTQFVYAGTNLDVPADQTGGRRQLELRSLSSLAVRDLPGTGGATQSFFSPDGQWIAFFTSAGELRKVSLAGGTPVTLLAKINGADWGFGLWTDDNNIIFSTPSAGLRLIPADGGEAVSLTTLDVHRQELEHRYAALVASSRAVLFAVRYTELRNPRIDAVLLDSGKRRTVVENADAPLVLSSGHLLFRRDEAVLIAPFDAQRLVLTGPAVPLIDDVRRDTGSPTGLPQLSVSRTGTLAYAPAVDTASTLALVGRDGSSEPLGVPPNSFNVLRISPNGQYVAFVTGSGDARQAHVYDLARGSATMLTQEGSDSGVAWQADSRTLAVDSRKKEGAGIFLKNLDGTERLLLARPADVGYLRNASWSPDGKLLAYTAQTGGQHDIWVLATGGSPTTKPFLNSAASEYSPRFSPDGRWLAYVSDESGRYEVYIRGYPSGDRFAVSTGGGNGPVWSPDGNEIFFQGLYQNVQKLMAVSVTSEGASLRLAKPMPLFDMRVPGSGVIEQYAASSNMGPRYDIMPDGKHFLMIRGADPQGTREIVLVQNWFEELKRLVPAK